ncbi:MAG TPA: Holliday junction resolvase RuvX [Desulfomonilia bacterium]
MAIDYGVKRLGIAISNPDKTMSVPLTIIDVRSDDSHYESIMKLIRDYNVEELIIGLPYNMDGTLGPSGCNVIQWSDTLKEKLGIPVNLWDERLSTYEAHNMLAQINIKHKKRKRIVDSLAASIILQNYIDSRNNDKEKD